MKWKTTRHIVYIAGAFSGETQWDVELNIRRAESLILPIAMAGATPICVHSMYRNFSYTLTWDQWMVITRTSLVGCTEMVIAPGAHGSKGTKNEIEVCGEIGIPVFDGLEKLLFYLGKEQ